MKELKVKEWFYNRESDKAVRYGITFEVTRRTDDIATMPLVEDGCVYLRVNKILKESEKAIQVELENGGYGNSNKNWTCWIPKSVCEVM